MRVASLALLSLWCGCEKTDPLFCAQNPGASGCPTTDGAPRDEGWDGDPTIDAQQCFGKGAYEICLTAPPTTITNVPSGAFNTNNDPLCLLGQPANWAIAGQPNACFVIGTDVIVQSLSVTGTRPLVILASGTIDVHINIDASSVRGGKTGPGAPAACPAFPTTPQSNANGGGGGAGGSFTTTGGDGGNGNSGTKGTASAAVPAPATLRAGCSGQDGADGDSAGNGAGGGRGGGAGADKTGRSAGGGGGGTGGMIVLAAPSLNIGANVVIMANGGSGGSGGNDTGGCGCTAGNDPTTTDPTVFAAGGTGGGGAGGSGFAGTSTAQPGNAAPGSNQGGGGGGGGAGYIQASGTLGTAAVSPDVTLSP